MKQFFTPQLRSLFSLLLLLASLGLVAQVHNGANEYTTIQAAINAANPGDVISVDAGTYSEQLVIDRPLTLRGAQYGVDPRPSVSSSRVIDGATETVVQATKAQIVVHIQASNVIIDGFEFKQITGTGGGEAIKTLDKYAGIQFSNNIITSTGYSNAMRLYGGEGFTIQQNYLKDIAGEGIVLRNGNDQVTPATDQRIINNDIDDVRGIAGAIVAYGETDLLVSGNVIHAMYAGVAIGADGPPYYEMHDIEVDGNEIEVDLATTAGQDYGILVNGNGENINIHNNIVRSTGTNTGPKYVLVKVGFDVVSTAASNPSNLRFNENHFERPTTANENYLTVGTNITNVVDASCNWWGTTSQTGVAALVSGSATVEPYLLVGTDDVPGTVGFQPVPNSCGGPGPVVNSNTGSTYTTIQAAIDAATSGDVISVDAGTYAENVVVNVGVTLQGAQANTARCTAAGSESVVDGGTGTAITIAADGVTINGFEITATAGGFGIAANGSSNLNIQYNYIHDIRTTGSGIAPYGIAYAASATATTVHIADNCISNVNNIGNSGYSGGGIAVGLSPNSGTVSGLVIERNTIKDVHTKNDTWSNGGRGAYGVLVNSGGGVVVTNGIISDNVITNLSGMWASGIGLEGKTPGMQVTNNTISDLVASQYLPACVKIEDADNVASFVITENSFTGTGAFYGIENATATAPSSATCNWWGTTDPASVAARVSGNVSTVPFLMNGTDSAPASGFQPVPNSCYGYPVINTTTSEGFMTIQGAIDDPQTTNGNIITVADGTYNEFVNVNKQLTIQGQSTAAIVKGPYSSDGSNQNVILITTSNVTLRNLTVTRDWGADQTSWDACTVNQGINFNSRPYVTLEGLHVMANRNGIFCNNSQNATITGCLIEDNRTGIQFGNNVSNLVFTNNIVRNNFTHGVGFNYDFNVLTLTNVQLHDNSITGNWYSQVNFQRNLGAAGTNVGDHNGLDLSCNWYGTTTLAINPIAAGEPGYAGQVPSQLGGTDPNLSNRYVVGLHAYLAEGSLTPYLMDGTDNEPGTAGFQSVPGSCSGAGPVVNTSISKSYLTIQGAIDDPQTTNGNIITVAAGMYAENISLDKRLDIRGPNYGISPNDSSRVAEATIVPSFNEPDPTAITSSAILYLQATASGTSFQGFTIDGDNPAMNGGLSMNGADVNAVEAFSSYEGVGGLTFQHNIVQNLSYAGLDLYNYNNGSAATTGNLVNDNKFDNILPADYGIAVLIYSNCYTTITNNVMTRVRLGVQTGNFYKADLGNSHDISGNKIESANRGIWHNMAYSNAATFSITNNVVTTVADSTNNRGVAISSIAGSVGVSVSGNQISGAKYGYDLWNCPTSNTVTVSGGTVIDCLNGVFANNYDGYASNANTSSYVVSGVAITNGTNALYVKDNNLNSNSATVSLTVQGGVAVSGSNTGLRVEGAGASAIFSGSNPATMDGASTYIELVSNGADVPAGDIDATQVLFDGQTGAAASIAQNFGIEDKIKHQLDDASLGLVRVHAAHLYATALSGSIQRGVDAADPSDVLHVGTATYDEQVLVNKSMSIIGETPNKPTVNFTGTVSGKPTLIDVSVPDVTLENLKLDVDQIKLSSAVIASSATGLGNLGLLNNDVMPYASSPGSTFGSYGNRNAFSVNYGGPINYRVSGGGGGITFTGNTVGGRSSGDILANGTARLFRAGISTDECYGTFSNNTLQTINQDIQVRFALGGGVSIANNNCNGGGIEVADPNASGGPIAVSGNIFDGTLATLAVIPRAAVLRLKGNYTGLATTVSGNTFNNADWGTSLENYRSATVSGNTFSPVANSTTYRLLTVNTKVIASSSGYYAPNVDLTLQSNTFNGSGTPGGTGVAFYNHDNDSPVFGNFNIGGAGALANNFHAGIGTFVLLDDHSGNTNPTPVDFPEYESGFPNTTMACWSTGMDISENQFDVGSGLQTPGAMSSGELAILEDALYHQPDAPCTGKLTTLHLRLAAKAMLEGPYDSGSGMMTDDLRDGLLTGVTYPLIPLAQPYNYTPVNYLGTETTTAGVLAVTGDDAIVDWVLVELRDAVTPTTVVARRAALLQRDGDIVNTDGTSPLNFLELGNGNYFVVVRHRNHLGVMSATAVALSPVPGTPVDFSDPGYGTYGTAARKIIGSDAVLWTGNSRNTDNYVKYTGIQNDRDPILSLIYVSGPTDIKKGYFTEDNTMDGVVKYIGGDNDRDAILPNLPGNVLSKRIEQLP